MIDDDITEQLSRAVAVLDALKSHASAVTPAASPPPEGTADPATVSAPQSGQGNTAAADSPEPEIAATPEKLREQLEASVLDLSARAVLAGYLPGLQPVLYRAIRPLVSLGTDGRALLRGDDGSTSELSPEAVDAILGEARDHFTPSTGVSGTGSRPSRYSPSGQPAWLTSQAAFERDRGRNK